MRLKRELPQLSGYIPVSEAARRLGVSKRRVYDFLDEGRLEGVKSGDIIMISEESIDGFKPLLKVNYLQQATRIKTTRWANLRNLEDVQDEPTITSNPNDD